MSEPSWYWTFVRLDPAGGSRVEPLTAVQAFFQRRIDPALAPNTAIQKQLMHIAHSEIDAGDRPFAELSLRCFISHQIEQTCIQLERQFGAYYGFTRQDLFGFVLDDDGKVMPDHRLDNRQSLTPPPYQTLSAKILQKFDPDRASLSAWTMRFVKQQPALNAFLLEQGLCMLSDWAILNDTKPQKLQRVLTQFHQLAEAEVESAVRLLDSYHAVYRRDRLHQGQKGPCLPPTSAQLQDIAHRFQLQTTHPVAPNAVLARLIAMAKRLRQYRVAMGGGKPPSQSIEQDESSWLDSKSQSHPSANDDRLQVEFLQTYRQQFVECLESALKQAIANRLQGLKPSKHSPFLSALTLFHCQKLTMSAIAPKIGLKAQYQVTRLLKLDELRADVRHWMLPCLRSSVQAIAQHYLEPNQLNQLDHQITIALETHVDALLQQERASARSARNPNSHRLFDQKLCQHLDTRPFA